MASLGPGADERADASNHGRLSRRQSPGDAGNRWELDGWSRGQGDCCGASWDRGSSGRQGSCRPGTAARPDSRPIKLTTPRGDYQSNARHKNETPATCCSRCCRMLERSTIVARRGPVSRVRSILDTTPPRRGVSPWFAPLPRRPRQGFLVIAAWLVCFAGAGVWWCCCRACSLPCRRKRRSDWTGVSRSRRPPAKAAGAITDCSARRAGIRRRRC